MLMLDLVGIYFSFYRNQVKPYYIIIIKFITKYGAVISRYVDNYLDNVSRKNEMEEKCFIFL